MQVFYSMALSAQALILVKSRLAIYTLFFFFCIPVYTFLAVKNDHFLIALLRVQKYFIFSKSYAGSSYVVNWSCDPGYNVRQSVNAISITFLRQTSVSIFFFQM